MRCLITGGAGYIGSILVDTLLQDGHSVTVLDSFMYRQSSLNHLCHRPEFEVVRGDARHGHVLAPLVADADVIIPLAALVGAPACDRDWAMAESVNLGAIQELCAQASPDKRIIIPNTNSGYGTTAPGTECTEDTPLNPISLYGRTKADAEAAVLARGNAISLRLATVFGMSPRMRLDLMVNDFVYRAVTDKALIMFEGYFRRNFIHVRDVARAFMHAIDNFDTMKDRAYNVGLSDANLTKVELCKRIQEHVPEFSFWENPIATDPDKRDYLVSNARIEATGFRPEYTLDFGIAELIKGFKMWPRSEHGNV